MLLQRLLLPLTLHKGYLGGAVLFPTRSLNLSNHKPRLLKLEGSFQLLSSDKHLKESEYLGH